MRKLMIVIAALIVFAAQPLVSAGEATRSAVYLHEETHHLLNTSASSVTNVRADIYLLDNRLDYASQHVLSEEIRIDGALVTPEIYSETRTEDSRVAQFSAGTIGGNGSKTITVTQIIRFDHLGPIDPSEVQGEMPGNLSAYTQPVDYLWESNDPVLKKKALELIAAHPDDIYNQAKAIFDFVENHLIYVEQVKDHSALWAYNSRVGDCSEYTHLFSALCRAADIPTRFVSGYGYNPDVGNMAPHAFVFIYLPGVGWVPMDLTWNRPHGMFGELSNDHLIEFTSGGENLVRDGKIQISKGVAYSPGGVVSIKSTWTTTRLVVVEPTIYSTLRGSTWKFSVDVKNLGTQSIDNVRVELKAEEAYFEIPPAQEVGTIGSGSHQMVYFDVPVTPGVENERVTAVVTYHSPYGTFRAESRTPPLPAASISPPPEEIFALILLACVVGAIAGLAVALLRR